MVRLSRVIKNFFQEHFWPIMLVLLFFILGVALGGLSVDNLRLEQQTDLKNYLDQNCQVLINQPLNRTTMVWQTILGNIETAAALWFLGLTVIGLPLVILIILIRGFILGFTVAFLIQQNSFQGILLIALGIFPQNLLYVPALIIGGVLAISFSLYLIRGRSSVSSSLWTWLLVYTLSMLLVAVILILAGLIEGLVGPSLLRILVPLLNS